MNIVYFNKHFITIPPGGWRGGIEKGWILVKSYYSALKSNHKKCVKKNLLAGELCAIIVVMIYLSRPSAASLDFIRAMRDAVSG